MSFTFVRQQSAAKIPSMAGGNRNVSSGRRQRAKSFRLSSAAIALMLAMVGALVAQPKSEAAGDLSVYRDGLGTTWQNWSWGTTVELASNNPVRSGVALAATIDNPWGGLSLRSSEAVPFSANNSLQFWLHGGVSGVSLRVATSVDDPNTQLTSFAPISSPANTWTFITIPSSALGNPAQIKRINVVGTGSALVGRFSIDDFAINAGTPPTTLPPTTPPTTTSPTTTSPTTTSPTTTPPATTTSPPVTTAPPPATTVPPPGTDGSIRFNATAAGRPFSAANYGTNSSFYTGSWSFANAQLRTRIAQTTGFIRFPGSQDSQRWGWASCELGYQFGGAVPCGPYGGLVRPSEFIGLLAATGSQGVVTLNVNATAAENAAFVAFMNGSVTDTRTLGVDQKGTNWQTVGYWARVRQNAGYPNPVGIRYWEFGNETFGGSVGPANCLSWGWEATWTCDPVAYVNGQGSGSARRDGYVSTRTALRSVDGSVLVGAPAVEIDGDYNNWSSGLIRTGGAVIDFLVVHPYFVWMPPANDTAGNALLLALPESHWSRVRNGFLQLEAQFGINRGIPILASEYNLTAGPQNDPAKRINGQGTALILADSVGQMAQINGYIGSNVFNLFGGAEADGSWFPQIRNDGSLTRSPSYYAFALWERFGSSLLPVSSSFNAASQLSVYAGRIDGAMVSIYVINKTGNPTSASIAIDGVTGLQSVQTDASVGSWLFDERPAFNGTFSQNDDLSNAPGVVRALNGERGFVSSFPAYSVSLLRIRIGGAPATSTTTTAATTVPTTTRPVTTTSSGITTTTPATTTTAPTGGSTCRVSFRTFWDSGAGYGADVQVTNLGGPLVDWRLSWAFNSQEVVTTSWGASIAVAGVTATATPASWIASLGTNATVGFGFNTTYRSPLQFPTSFALNGRPCTQG